ncbi:MAG: hypothetical protein R3F17_03165 [Planctomycetota bacterium]
MDEDIERLSVPMDIRFRDLSRGQAMKAMTIAALGLEPRSCCSTNPSPASTPPPAKTCSPLLERIDTGRQSILIATHNSDGGPPGDRVVILHEEGRVTQAGPIDQLVPEAQPRNPCRATPARALCPQHPRSESVR